MNFACLRFDWLSRGGGFSSRLKELCHGVYVGGVNGPSDDHLICHFTFFLHAMNLGMRVVHMNRWVQNYYFLG